uniref:RING-type E3 ubiquitin transferase n=1 Tax=Meloidogyne incognita TaxID=6306 RepID=A0A914KP20_MELIC
MGTTNDNDGSGDMDICRVCRLTGNDALYHPCLCTGSIKYIHQDCLLQWLKYSKKDVCELCNHKFSFRLLYRADMPERLPLRDLLRGIFMIVARFLRLGFTYTLVLTCWLGLVPLMAARTHRLVFSGFISSIFLKRAVRCWCRIVGGWLQLDSYLLPSEKDKNNVDQRENQRQRARQRLMRGDQNEQLGLLEVLEAIEDDTTDDEPADENENDHVENDTNNAQNNDKGFHYNISNKTAQIERAPLGENNIPHSYLPGMGFFRELRFFRLLLSHFILFAFLRLSSFVFKGAHTYFTNIPYKIPTSTFTYPEH